MVPSNERRPRLGEQSSAIRWGRGSRLSRSSPRSSEKRGARAEEEAEVIPVAAPGNVVERKLLPAAEDMNEQHHPSRKSVPKTKEEIFPPHDYRSFCRSSRVMGSGGKAGTDQSQARRRRRQRD